MPRDAAITPATPDAGDAPRPAKVFVDGAGRCGECHEKMFDEWGDSAHSRAATSPLYVAALAASGKQQCGQRCHTPLANALGPKDLVTSEGVTCDVCHTLREPAPSPAGGSYALAIDDMVKYGPRCDLQNHYFHRMGCSPEHSKAEVCGACHWWEPNGLPVFTEYKDWKASEAAAKGVQCQDCHMPAEKAALAVGATVREGVPHHGLLGIAQDLRPRMVAVVVSVAQRPDGVLESEVQVTNVGAGHSIPSGLPERRLRVRYRLRDAAGSVTDEQVVMLGRELVDATGALVPFWKATKVGADTRIAPGAAWKRAFTSETAPTTGDVSVDIAYVAMEPSIADALSIAPPDREEVTVATLKIPFGAAHKTGRAKLPAKAEFTPKAAGKRSKARPKSATPKVP